MSLRRLAALLALVVLTGLTACTDVHYYIQGRDPQIAAQTGLIRKSGGYPGILMEDSSDASPVAVKPGSTVALYNYLVQTDATSTSTSGNIVTTYSFTLGNGAEAMAPFMSLLTDGFKQFDVKLDTKPNFSSSEAATTLTHYNDEISKSFTAMSYAELAGVAPLFVKGLYERFFPVMAKDLGVDYFLVAQLNYGIYTKDPDKLISITPGVPVVLNVQMFDAAGHLIFATEKRSWHATEWHSTSLLHSDPPTKEEVGMALLLGVSDDWKEALAEIGTKLKLAKPN